MSMNQAQLHKTAEQIFSATGNEVHFDLCKKEGRARCFFIDPYLGFFQIFNEDTDGALSDKFLMLGEFAFMDDVWFENVREKKE